MKTQVSDSVETLLGEVAGEFCERLARGERPDVEEYALRHPDLADQLRKVLPALELVGVSSAGLGAERREFQAPRKLGDFEIIRELGRGGMGVVYEAEQLSMGRRVALKVLPFAAMVQEKGLERFRNEVRAAATLSHNHIVSIYSVGEERGVHFYAMQLIRGQSLAEVITQLRDFHGNTQAQLSSISRRLLSEEAEGPPALPAADTKPLLDAKQSTVTRSRRTAEFFHSAARLGIEAAEGLQHAHERGIIHRDIKPGNLLLNSEGRLYIADFGLARIEADAGMTMSGDMIGTLRYMAPEQALAKRVVIDHRADIYSLGTTLYELLTLEPPFAESDRKELLKQIAFQEPRPLRKLDRDIPADLETIVLKTMAKDPEERYQSAEALAADLRAFLENRPISARPTSILERLMRVGRRHTLAIGGALAVMAAVVAVLGVALVVVAKARQDAMSKAEELQAEYEESERLLTHVGKSVDAMLERLSWLPDGDPTRTAVMEEEIKFYQEVQRVSENKPAARHRLASALVRLATFEKEVSNYGPAVKKLQRAEELFAQLLAEDPTSAEHAIALSYAWMVHGVVMLIQNRPDEGEDCLQQAVRFGEMAMQLAPRNDEYRWQASYPWDHLGIRYSTAGKKNESLAAHRKALELQNTCSAAKKSERESQINAGFSQFLYSVSLSHTGERAAANSVITKVIETYQRFHEADPEDWTVKTRLGKFYMMRGSLTLPFGEPLNSDLQRSVQLAPNDADVLNECAWLVGRRPCASAAELDQALQWVQTARTVKPGYRNWWNTLGAVQYRRGEWQEAIAALERSKELWKVSRAHDLFFLAMAYERLGQHDRAVPLFYDAVTDMDKNTHKSKELTAFRREAAALLGLPE